MRTPRAQVAEIQRLQAKLEDKTRVETYDLQRRCAVDAQTQFRELSKSVNGAAYESHYNAKLNRCFVLVSTGAGKTLADAVGGHVLAAYEEHIADSGQIEMQFCNISPTSSDVEVCKTEAQFDQFVAQYME